MEKTITFNSDELGVLEMYISQKLEEMEDFGENECEDYEILKEILEKP